MDTLENLNINLNITLISSTVTVYFLHLICDTVLVDMLGVLGLGAVDADLPP